ncbi:MAG TPA: MlaD family protein [Candidatus Dormibacteraeota bacterium]
MVLTSGQKAFRAGIGLLVGILVIILLAAGINASFGVPFNLSLGWPPGFDYTLNADFNDANGVAQGAPVVIAGNPVGQVTSVHVQGKVAVVSMRIDRQYSPVHSGTIARIRYGTLLASKYIELSSVASGRRSIDSGSTLPTDQTVTPVDFDQFLSALDPKTRQQLQVVIQQAGGGVDGQAQAINLLFSQLRPLSEQSVAPLQTFQKHNSDLDRIVANLAIVSQRLGQSHEQLGGFVQHTGEVTGTLDSRDQQLDSLLLHLANTTQDFDQTLNGEEGNFHTSIVQFDPTARDLNSLVVTVNSYLHPNVGVLEEGISSLTTEIGGAINTGDANGSFLRQYFVYSQCYGSFQTSKTCKENAGGVPAAPASKPAQPAPGATPKACATPAPLPSLIPVLPGLLPSPTPLVCPSPTPCVPTSPPPTPSTTCKSGTSSTSGGGLNLGGIVNGLTSTISGWLGQMLSP